MNKFYKRIILDGLENEEMLTEWEVEFISNLAEKPDEYELSEKQKEVLKRIEHKIASGG